MKRVFAVLLVAVVAVALFFVIGNALAQTTPKAAGSVLRPGRVDSGTMPTASELNGGGIVFNTARQKFYAQQDGGWTSILTDVWDGPGALIYGDGAQTYAFQSRNSLCAAGQCVGVFGDGRSGSGSTASPIGVYGSAITSGTANPPNVDAVVGEVYTDSSANVNLGTNFSGYFEHTGAGIIADLAVFRAFEPVDTGAGSITDAYGYLVGNGPWTVASGINHPFHFENGAADWFVDGTGTMQAPSIITTFVDAGYMNVPLGNNTTSGYRIGSTTAILTNSNNEIIFSLNNGGRLLVFNNSENALRCNDSGCTLGNAANPFSDLYGDASMRGTCTLNGASPSTCTATVTAGARCVCSGSGTTAAAAVGCAANVATTVLTVTAANGLTSAVNYICML